VDGLCIGARTWRSFWRTLSFPALTACGFAILNLAGGVALALNQPSRRADLQTIHEWCSRWLLEGVRLYSIPNSTTDYPPHAIVFLSPIAMLPLEWVVHVVAALTLIATPILACLVVRATSPHARLSAAATPIFLFLCWGGVRTLLQFTRLSLTLTFAALMLAESRSTTSGMLLGLALVKPHIAGPVALWIAFRYRARAILVAAIVVASGVCVYCLRVGVDPSQVASSYVDVLVDVHGAEAGLQGRTSVRRWIFAAVDDPYRANTLWIAAAFVLLAIPCAMAAIERRRSSHAAAAVPAAFCLWSLLSFYHIGNNMILLLPAFVFLWLADDPKTAIARRVLAALLQIELMIDIPVRLRDYAPAYGPGCAIIVDFDRFLVALTFVYVIALWCRLRRSGPVPAGLREPVFAKIPASD
jgi:uncharacterized membrane protein YecN with MAPEG domain